VLRHLKTPRRATPFRTTTAEASHELAQALPHRRQQTPTPGASLRHVGGTPRDSRSLAAATAPRVGLTGGGEAGRITDGLPQGYASRVLPLRLQHLATLKAVRGNLWWLGSLESLFLTVDAPQAKRYAAMSKPPDSAAFIVIVSVWMCKLQLFPTTFMALVPLTLQTLLGCTRA